MTEPIMNRRLSEPLRWANILLRGLHMAAVVVLGAALLGAPVSAGRAVAALVATGAIMLALDTWKHPGHLREASGMALEVKLVLVVWMAWDESVRPVLFWLIVAGSTLFSHASSRVRHIPVFGRRP